MSTCAMLHKALSSAPQLRSKGCVHRARLQRLCPLLLKLRSKGCVHCARLQRLCPLLQKLHCPGSNSCQTSVTTTAASGSNRSRKRHSGAKALILTPTDSSSGLEPGDPCPRLPSPEVRQSSATAGSSNTAVICSHGIWHVCLLSHTQAHTACCRHHTDKRFACTTYHSGTAAAVGQIISGQQLVLCANASGSNAVVQQTEYDQIFVNHLHYVIA